MKSISKIAVDLNVTVNTLIQNLKKISDKEFDLNSKLDSKEIEFLTKIFQKDKDEKTKADKKKAVFHFDLDDNFSFQQKEKRDFSELFSEYKNKLSDIEQLKRKENRFWALEAEEIETLLKSKFKRIYEIQKSVKIYRELRNVTNSFQSDRDPYENFRWGGLRGEEAHIAYWNCD